MSAEVRVGLISDTHGLLRPEAARALAGVEHILHAGDVGRPEVLTALRRIAPLTAVRGNVDREAWAAELPRSAEVRIHGTRIHMRHILEELDLDPRTSGFDVVVFGHSHRPTIERRDEVLFVNPGSAGPRRFDLPVSLALLILGPRGPRADLVRLEKLSP